MSCYDIYDGERGTTPGIVLAESSELDMWLNLPYMRGVYINEIGDIDRDKKEEDEEEEEEDGDCRMSIYISEDDEYADMPSLVPATYSSSDAIKDDLPTIITESDNDMEIECLSEYSSNIPTEQYIPYSNILNNYYM